MNYLLRLFGIKTLESILAKFEIAIADLVAHERQQLQKAEQALANAARQSSIAEEAKAIATKAAEVRTNLEKLLGK